MPEPQAVVLPLGTPCAPAWGAPVGIFAPPSPRSPLLCPAATRFLCSGGASRDLPELTESNRHFSIYSTSVQGIRATYLQSKPKADEDEGAITSTA